jgi:hypothetical protein
MSRWVNLDLESLQVDLEVGFAAGISDLLAYRQHITVSRPVRYDRLCMFMLNLNMKIFVKYLQDLDKEVWH